VRVIPQAALKTFDFVSIDSAVFEMGSTMSEVDHCVQQWGSRLIDSSWQMSFRDWILKEYPAYTVRLAPYLMSRFPVTNAQYAEFLTAASRPAPESFSAEPAPDHPVWGVAFHDAVAFAGWLSERSGSAIRLPSEAEWEYAARGPERVEYPYGNEFDPAKCNTIESGRGATSPVDCYPQGASGHGVFDLAGNVEEWTSDYYKPYPGGAFIRDDLTRSLGSNYRVLRGGSFALGGDLARGARRHGPHPGASFRYRGFRLVMSQ
jgi:formylglycine-generating enzyme required for sulfatase activity